MHEDLSGGSELCIVLEKPCTAISRSLHPVLGEDASAVSQTNVGPTEVGSHYREGGIVRRLYGHGREPKVFWAFNEGRGNGSCIAGALILMSDWCGFVPTPIIENPGAYKP